MLKNNSPERVNCFSILQHTESFRTRREHFGFSISVEVIEVMRKCFVFSYSVSWHYIVLDQFLFINN